MADIELVIKIPEEDWEFLKESGGCRWSRTILDGVINGTPLSEELTTIKAETIIDELEKIKAEIEYCRKKHNCGVLECLDIIDKEIKGAWRSRWR